jgi:serine protease Do
VKSVSGNTDAAESGLAAGDVILRVQDKTVSNAAEAQAAIEAARAANREYVLVLVDPKVHRSPGPEWMALRVSDD